MPTPWGGASGAGWPTALDRPGCAAWTGYGVLLACAGRAVLPGGGWVPVALAVGLALAAGAVPQAFRSVRRRRAARW